MKSERIKWVVIFISIFMMCGCGTHYSVKGRVVDAETGAPIEGAVVAVNWVRYKLSPPGLPSNKERYGTSEFVTEEGGYFSIPKYIFGEHVMGVYKKGYVCWSSETIFNPQGKTREEMFLKRLHHHVTAGMIIKLQPVVTDEFSYEHASFAVNVSTDLRSSPIFDKAIGDLEKEYQDQMRKKKDTMIEQKKIRESEKRGQIMNNE